MSAILENPAVRKLVLPADREIGYRSGRQLGGRRSREEQRLCRGRRGRVLDRAAGKGDDRSVYRDPSPSGYASRQRYTYGDSIPLAGLGDLVFPVDHLRSSPAT